MNLQTLTTTLVFLSLAFGFGRADGEDLPNAKKNTSLDSKFIVGSKWKGTVRELKGQEELTTDVLVTVTKREGPQFEGTYAVFSGAFVYAVAGTVERNQVSFKFVKIEKMPTGANNPANLVGVQNKGTLRMDAKTRKPTITSFYTWENAKDASVVKRGEVVVALVEEIEAETAPK